MTTYLILNFLACVVLSVVVVGLIVLASALLCKLAIKMMFIARIVVSLLAAGFLNGFLPIFPAENMFWFGYAIWAAICLTGCFLICSLPRCDHAFGIACTTLVSTMVVSVFVLTIVIKVPWLEKAYYANIMLTQIVMKSVGLVASSIVYMRQPQRKARVVLKNKLMINLERVLASLIYGVTCMFLFMSGNSNAINSNAVIQIGVGVVVFIGSFVADILLTKKMK